MTQNDSEWNLNLKRLRIKTGLSQEDLADETSFSQSTINRLESGKVAFGQQHLLEFSEAFKMPVSHLVNFLQSGDFDKNWKSIESSQADHYIKIKKFLTEYSNISDQLIEHNKKLEHLSIKEKVWALKMLRGES